MIVFLSIVAVLVCLYAVASHYDAKQRQAVMENPAIWDAPGFTPDRKWVGNGTGIAIDATGSTLCLAHVGRPPTVIRAADVTELSMHDMTEISSEQVTVTDRGSQLVGAAVGAALAGPAGLIVGGLSGKTKTKTETRKKNIGTVVSLWYCVGYSKHQHVLDLGSASENREALESISAAIKRALASPQNSDSLEAGNSAPTTHPAPALPSPTGSRNPRPKRAKPAQKPQALSSTSTADELVKLSKLRDQGILTPDEFDDEKRKLLARG